MAVSRVMSDVLMFDLMWDRGTIPEDHHANPYVCNIVLNTESHTYTRPLNYKVTLFQFHSLKTQE